MKQLIYSLIITVIIISLGIFTIKMLEEETRSIHTLLLEVESNIYADKWDDAIKIITKVQEQWDKCKNIWPMLIDHLEIDNVNANIAKLQAYISNNDKSESLSNLAVLKILIMHIPEKESFIIQNIL